MHDIGTGSRKRPGPPTTLSARTASSYLVLTRFCRYRPRRTNGHAKSSNAAIPVTWRLGDAR